MDAICANPLKNGQFSSGSHDKTIMIWDANAKCIKTLTGHTNGVWCLNYFPDGKRLLSASSDGTSKIWDVNSGKCTQTLKKHTGRTYCATMNDDASKIATCGSDKMLCVWDAKKLDKPLFTNTQSQSCIMRCDFSNDQKSIHSVTLDGAIQDMDIASQKMTVQFDTVEELKLQSDGEITKNICYCVKSLKKHPDGGNKFAVGAEFKLISVCDVDSSRPEGTKLQTHGKYTGHFSSVRQIEVSEDFKYLLSSSEDHSIFLWDTATQKPKRILAGHTDLAVSAVHMPDCSIERGHLPRQEHHSKQFLGRVHQNLELRPLSHHLFEAQTLFEEAH